MKIKIEPFLMRKGNKLAKAAIEFEQTDGLLAGWHLVGFTICEDVERGLFVLFPASITKSQTDSNKTYFFLRPKNDEQLGILENLILDTYESMIAFNNPIKGKQ